MAEKENPLEGEPGSHETQPSADVDSVAKRLAVRDLRETLLTILEDKEEATDPLPASWRQGHLVMRGAGRESSRPLGG